MNFLFFFFFVVVFLYIDARIRFGHICERSHEKIWKATSLKVWERKQQQQKSEWKLPLESGSCFFLILLLLLKNWRRIFLVRLHFFPFCSFLSDRCGNTTAGKRKKKKKFLNFNFSNAGKPFSLFFLTTTTKEKPIRQPFFVFFFFLLFVKGIF